MLFIASSLKIKEKLPLPNKRKIKDVLLIGTAQALALIPGMSRCGATISASFIRGWKMQKAITFSFMLAIPTIIGGNILESIKMLKLKELNMPNISAPSYLIAFLSSFIIGLISIRFIFSLTDKKKIRPFALYCISMGIISFIYINFIQALI